MDKLKNAREKIVEIDKEIARLFEMRMDCAKEVAEVKRDMGMPVLDAERERALITKNSTLIKNEEYRSYYVDFLQSTMDISKRYQSRILDGRKIAYSGVEGAFAWIATKRIFPVGKAVAYKSFEAAYKAVIDGECDCCVLPLENSFAGDVARVMDLAFEGSLSINGIYDLEIMQNLLAVSGAKISDIKEVISHPQALDQCAKYIEGRGFIRRESQNTATAAKALSESKRLDLAVIASKETADLWGLSILEKDINEARDNTTRFAVFSKTPIAPNPNDNHFIMYFTVKHEAGALGRAVQVIGKNGFNLRALKSRPTKEKSWEYYFYVEGEGNIHSESGKNMLKELNGVCYSIKIAGSFGKEKKLSEAKDGI